MTTSKSRKQVKRVIVVNTDYVAGKEVKETLGIARGSTIRAKNIGKDIKAGFRSIVGGKITEYSQMFEESREEAINLMVEDAKKMGADAVVNVRFTTSMVMSGAAEILAYGTAVKLGR